MSANSSKTPQYQIIKIHSAVLELLLVGRHVTKLTGVVLQLLVANMPENTSHTQAKQKPNQH
jgi:hypothetical protein